MVEDQNVTRHSDVRNVLHDGNTTRLRKRCKAKQKKYIIDRDYPKYTEQTVYEIL